ncbi:MAG: hypothetical protein U9R21_07675 [Candidatus Thermoplasmatota archaeon]|nr:hypothetical protein [Candidatus Thermoplasmatota archaeon]
MSNLKNSQAVRCVLQTLINKIGRRTSKGFATVTLDEIIKEFMPRYDFLKYIKIEKMFYSGGIDAVSVSSDIDLVDPAEFYNAIEDIMETTVKNIKKKADFFFIREVEEELNDVYGLNLKERNIDLSRMQLQFIVDKRQEFQMKNSEMVEIVIGALNNVIDKKFPETQKTKKIVESIRELEKKYDFLSYVEISNEPTSGGFHRIRVLSSINKVSPLIVSEAIQKHIHDVGNSLNWTGGKSFIESLEEELGEKRLAEIKKIGINLKHINFILMQREHKILVEKALEALAYVIGKDTSNISAVAVIDAAIEKLEERHDVLKYIKIDKSRYEEGADAISVMPEINNVESYRLGKAIRQVIKVTGSKLGSRTATFIEDFKNQLGAEYLFEIGKIGVNLHFLELKFA